jgi:glycyl-tRNA synthetase beta chain
MGELLLELLSEEIPARMQRRAIADLSGLVRGRLAAAQIPAASLEGHVTPRRLAVIADGIPLAQPDLCEERRGPRVDAPAAAIDGFLRSTGIGAIDECEIRDLDRGRFYFAVIRRPGRAAAAVLPELLRGAIGALDWPKSMRWPGSPLRWVRPLVAVTCLYDGEVVLLDLGDVPVGRTTYGHRFRAPGALSVRDAADYLQKLERADVVLDHDRRREAIRIGLDRQAAALGIRVEPDPALLDEVTGLAEFPVVLAGAIDAEFMSLPPEVLATAMRAHQKYFSCLDADGRAAARFLFVANNCGDDGGAAIVAGNERVLRARLADARFFWDQDRKTRLADRVEALKARVYHDKLGSVYDRTLRLEELAGFVAGEIGDSLLPPRARRAARLAKADLSTGMVGEFPELQGIIGGYYARQDGEDERVARAIAEHYRPQGPDDTCPTERDSVALALADKIETLCGFFRIGERPTGSRDPFALRRAALGIIRMILENHVRVSLRALLQRGGDVFPTEVYGIRDLVPDLLPFIVDRMKVHLRAAGVRHDLIAAAFAQPDGVEDDLVRLLARVDALRDFLATADGADLLTAYRRAANIVAIEEKADGVRHDGPVDPMLLTEPQEKTLHHHLDGAAARTEPLLRDEKFEQAMQELSRLRTPIDHFFAAVTVNATQSELRANRLRMLSRIRATMNRLADFSQIEG